jgi:hypothetical protein
LRELQPDLLSFPVQPLVRLRGLRLALLPSPEQLLLFLQVLALLFAPDHVRQRRTPLHYHLKCAKL